jgi:hypothetical protein
LDGRFLCFKHHLEAHGGNFNNPPQDAQLLPPIKAAS